MGLASGALTPELAHVAVQHDLRGFTPPARQRQKTQGVHTPARPIPARVDMRPLLLFAAGLGGLAALPAAAQEADKVDYKIEIDPKSVFSTLRDRDGKRSRVVRLQFTVK